MRKKPRLCPCCMRLQCQKCGKYLARAFDYRFSLEPWVKMWMREKTHGCCESWQCEDGVLRMWTGKRWRLARDGEVVRKR